MNNAKNVCVRCGHVYAENEEFCPICGGDRERNILDPSSSWDTKRKKYIVITPPTDNVRFGFEPAWAVVIAAIATIVLPILGTLLIFLFTRHPKEENKPAARAARIATIVVLLFALVFYGYLFYVVLTEGLL